MEPQIDSRATLALPVSPDIKSAIRSELVPIPSDATKPQPVPWRAIALWLAITKTKCGAQPDYWAPQRVVYVDDKPRIRMGDGSQLIEQTLYVRGLINRLPKR